jgi:hypothetical protein
VPERVRGLGAAGQGPKVHVIPADKLDYAAAQDDYVSLRSEVCEKPIPTSSPTSGLRPSADSPSGSWIFWF